MFSEGIKQTSGMKYVIGILIYFFKFFLYEIPQEKVFVF